VDNQFLDAKENEKRQTKTSPFDFLQDKKQSELNLRNDIVIT